MLQNHSGDEKSKLVEYQENFIIIRKYFNLENSASL